ncbi:hypothetical protein PAL_GLEAN10004232 [Pteropus alecto]|uniref:Homologous recombination OB-fold protein OB-fold domain-containing protein n=1 Tax=Pteropus alecto TaxID=9402 RepID=L5KSE9_PTEAL|nr:hypothetical protein PAL_GLEAN10004232 [Pteropus alecto]
MVKNSSLRPSSCLLSSQNYAALTVILTRPVVTRKETEACSLQKLFAVEEEFEDEDFLSAVEDAENQFAGLLPMNAGCLRPVPSKPQETVQAQSSRQLPSCPTAPSEDLDLPALGLRLPTSSMLRAVRSPPFTGTTSLKPVSTSGSWIGSQRRVTLTEALQEPARPQSSASHPLFTFDTQQQVIGGFEGPEQDEFDKVLASMELELGVSTLQTPIVTNHLVQLVTAANRTPQQPTRTATHTKTRRFPGPAGILPHQHSGKNLEEIMVSTPQTPTHGALAKFQTEIVTSSQALVEEDFERGPWLTMKSALGLDERDPTCFLYTYSIIMVLRKAALKQLPGNKVPNMAVMVKSLTRSTMDASVVFKDPTGEMQGTVHRSLLETRQNELKPGSVLLLKQIGVFSPSLRNHYLNVTPNNLVHIYSPESRDRNFLKLSQPFSKGPGSFHGSLQHKTSEPGEGLRTAQNPEAEASPEEELPEADDLDGLLSELPEDFFCGTSSWDCPETGHPP